MSQKMNSEGKVLTIDLQGEPNFQLEDPGKTLRYVSTAGSFITRDKMSFHNAEEVCKNTYMTDEDYETAIKIAVKYFSPLLISSSSYGIESYLDVIIYRVTERTVEKHEGDHRISQLVKLWKLLEKPLPDYFLTHVPCHRSIDGYHSYSNVVYKTSLHTQVSVIQEVVNSLENTWQSLVTLLPKLSPFFLDVVIHTTLNKIGTLAKAKQPLDKEAEYLSTLLSFRKKVAAPTPCLGYLFDTALVPLAADHLDVVEQYIDYVGCVQGIVDTLAVDTKGGMFPGLLPKIQERLCKDWKACSPAVRKQTLAIGPVLPIEHLRTVNIHVQSLRAPYGPPTVLYSWGAHNLPFVLELVAQNPRITIKRLTYLVESILG